MKFSVQDMSCGHCTAAIETAIADAGGTATADLTDRTVAVAGMDANRAAAVIAHAGYTPVLLD